MNPLLLPFSEGFRLGVAVRHAGYRCGWFKIHSLSRPVVSIGNLTVGGTGKTPLVVCVAKILLRRGWKPSILTRGYGRRSKVDMAVVPPGVGRSAIARDIGDEPALLARALPEVPIVVCVDRWRGGQVAEERYKVDAHILDDGFQHLALARDVDLVALDTTQTLSDLQLLPAGRQREPLSALRRAQIVVLTRIDSADPQYLEKRVLDVHPAARVFRSRTRLITCRDAWSGECISPAEIGSRKAAAFCAIGNPGAFFGDLRRWGFKLVVEHAFPDHHAYTGGEIQRLVANARTEGAGALVTTQKDAVKFSRDWNPQLPIWASEIEAQILDAEDFERVLLSYLERAH